MSTVIYKDGLLLSDSLNAKGDYSVTTPAKKIFLDDKFIFAGAGYISELHVMYHWLRGDLDELPQLTDVKGILLTHNGGVFTVYQDKTFIKHKSSDTVCVGSGSLIADALLSCTDLTPHEVMEQVKLRDINTGGETVSYHVSEIKQYFNPIDKLNSN